MKNKKGVLFGVLGVLAGGVIAIGLQTHAARVQNPAPSLAPQVQQAPTATKNGSDSTNVSDPKDSPETGTSVETPDAPESNASSSEVGLPGSGHADPSGDVNNQSEGED